MIFSCNQVKKNAHSKLIRFVIQKFCSLAQVLLCWVWCFEITVHVIINHPLLNSVDGDQWPVLTRSARMSSREGRTDDRGRGAGSLHQVQRDFPQSAHPAWTGGSAQNLWWEQLPSSAFFNVNGWTCERWPFAFKNILVVTGMCKYVRSYKSRNSVI